MGKEGEIWDDSALIKAFDHAVSKYKTMHGSTAGEKAVTNTEEYVAAAETDHGSKESRSKAEEHVQNDDKNTSLETTAKIGETAKLLEIKENSPSELGSSADCIGSSSILNGNLPPSNENPTGQSDPQGKHMVSSYVHNQNDAMWYPNGDEGYNELLNKYHEIEGQRLQILEQLNQYSNWNYQDPFPGASISGEYQASVPLPYDTVTCSCPYGCQNWVVPCNSLPTACPSGTCTDENCNAIPRGTHNGNSVSPEDPDFVKTAMVAAERALSSLRKEANGGYDKELGMETGNFTDSTTSATDLDVVLKAWYSAGFYTGKYLSEQSMEKRKHG